MQDEMAGWHHRLKRHEFAFTLHRNETLASPSAASWQRLTEVAQTHLAQASGTKKFSGLHRRNKMYLSYFRDRV